MKRKYSSSTGCPTSNIAVLQGVPHQIEQFYRVSHIKLDRVNGSKLRFGGQIRKLKKNESF